MPKRILYIVPHRINRSPGQRFRCEHFIPKLQEQGYAITYANLLSKWDDFYFYKKGAYFAKLFILVKSFIKRIFHLYLAQKHDAVFIYREAFMIGTTCFEKSLKLIGKPIIYDFDDSIWLNDTSEGNKHLAWLKNTKKTNTIIKLASHVIVGNEYLAKHAKQFNKQVSIIPTTIDTEYHKPQAITKNTDKICIGWTGTETTLKHFVTLEKVLQKLQTKYGNRIYFKVINNISYTNSNLDVESIIWTTENEIPELLSMDIGIMPLPNNEWTQGKCGFKGLQYMALEIPCIMSPVGVNTEIIEHGVNGYLANTNEDWEFYLSELIDNELLRKQIGQNGRKTIINSFSIESQQEKYISIFNSVTLSITEKTS